MSTYFQCFCDLFVTQMVLSTEKHSCFLTENLIHFSKETAIHLDITKNNK